MRTMPSIITLTTDFGIRDGFPAAMLGVVLSINPEVRVVDLCHDIAPGDIAHGAYILATVPQYFPAGSVHVAVVDPGVGSARKILAVRAFERLYIAPDNGLLGYVLQRCSDAEVRFLDNQELWLEHPSATFHGRDVMAPAAAYLSKGIPFSDVGPVANSWEPAPYPPALNKGDVIEGHIIHVDRFGNLVTNISGEMRGTVIVGEHHLDTRVSTFAEGTSNIPVVLTGSSGWLEIAVNGGSAAEIIQKGVGAPVSLVLDRT